MSERSKRDLENDTKIVREIFGDAEVNKAMGKTSEPSQNDKQSDREQLISAMKAMVEAQHAGPITDEMFTAWTNAKALLMILDKR